MSMQCLKRPITGLFLTGLLLASAANAGDRGTPEEAQALVARAIALYDQSGAEAAFTAIQDLTGGFIDRDLYVFVYGPQRTLVAHGAQPERVGTEVDSLRDEDGVAFGSRMMDEATAEGSWTDYKWRDPVTGQVMKKSSWVVRHDGHVFGAGVYKTD